MGGCDHRRDAGAPGGDELDELLPSLPPFGLERGREFGPRHRPRCWSRTSTLPAGSSSPDSMLDLEMRLEGGHLFDAVSPPRQGPVRGQGIMFRDELDQMSGIRLLDD